MASGGKQLLSTVRNSVAGRLLQANNVILLFSLFVAFACWVLSIIKAMILRVLKFRRDEGLTLPDSVQEQEEQGW